MERGEIEGGEMRERERERERDREGILKKKIQTVSI